MFARKRSTSAPAPTRAQSHAAARTLSGVPETRGVQSRTSPAAVS